MAGVPQEVKRARQKVMESDGLAHAGTYSVLEKGKGGLYSCLPAMYCQSEGVGVADDVEVYIDFGTGAVITIPADRVGEGGELP